MKQHSNESSFKDPVCGMEVSRTTAIDEFVYQGKTHYFCSGACREAFEAEPEKYILHHRQQWAEAKVSMSADRIDSNDIADR